MAAEEKNAESEPGKDTGKRGKAVFLVGLVLAILGGGGGFYATYSGILFAPADHESNSPAEGLKPENGLPDVAFVPVEPIVVSLQAGDRYQHLRFRAQLEVPRGYEEDVVTLMPRVVDVLNGYLRALDYDDISTPSALVRIRAQMLRRIETVLGRERVNDLLIMEFVPN